MGVIPGNSHRTYQIIAPIPTHFRPATCEEVGCQAYANGWKTIVPSDSPQADYIRSGRSGRRCIESTGLDQISGGMVEFMFEPGQKCFGADKHVVPLERDPLFRVRESGQTITHTRPELWAEDMDEHLSNIRRIREG